MRPTHDRMTRNPPTTRLLALLLAVSVLAAGVPAVVSADGGSASFGDNTVTVTRGDTVSITVSHSGPATVYVGSERSGFLLEVDIGGAGTHTFTIDTYATTGPASSFVSGAGTPTLHTHRLQRPLAATEYAMNVTVDGVEQDIGSLTVEKRGSMDATTQIAPSSIFGEDALTIDRALGAATNNTTVAQGDAAVFTVQESGLQNAFNADDLDGDGNANGIAVRLTELDPEPNTEPETLFVSEEPGFTVLPDLENDRFLVVWDTSTRTLRPHSNHSWRLDVVLTEQNRLVESETMVASSRVQLVAPVVTTIGPDHRTFYPWEDPVVTLNGTTNLAPGTTLNVRAKSTEPPFLAQQDVTVTENGTFSGMLDVSRAAPSQSVPVWVLHHRPATERTVVRYAEQASFAFHDQVSNGKIIDVQSIHLGAGGFVEARTNGSRIGVSEYLSPGTHEDVPVHLNTTLVDPANVTVVAHLDRDLDERFNASVDRPYERLDENNSSVPVTATAHIRLQGTGITTTTTTTPASTTSTNSTTMTTTTHLAASGPLVERTPIPALAAAESGARVPFPAWATIVAVLAGALLFRRRGEGST